MKRFIIPVLATILTFGSIAQAVNVSVPQSTGYGQVLIGNAAGGSYTPVATSTLGITGSAASVVGTVSTSTVPTVGQLAYWTSNAYPSLLGSVATTSLTATSPLSLSQAISVIGSSASALSLDTTGTWSGNAGTVTNGVYTTTFNNLFDVRLTATTSLPQLTTLAGLSLPYSQLTGTPSLFSYPFPSNATSTLIDFSGSIKVGTLAGLIAGNSGNLYAVSTTSMNASITGLAGTATALAANPANCSAGSFPLGIDASGAVESCTDAWTEAENTAAGYTSNTGTVTSIATTYPLTGGTITTTGTLGIAFGTTTANTWADTQTFTKAIVINEGTTATSTFAGNVKVTGNLQVDGMFFAPVTLVSSGDATINGKLTVTGALDFDTMTSALLLTGAGGDVAEYAGTSCTNQFVRSLSALGAATCATVGTADVAGLDISDDTNLAATWPVILTGDTLSFGGLATSSPLSAGLLYATGVNTMASVSTSTAVSMSITGNAGTVTTNANLSGAVVSSGSNATTFGSATAGVLGTPATGIPTFMATSTLYGAGGIPNSALALSTISGISLGGTLANLTATNSTLTFSGTYTGATARTIGLNLGNANTWSVLQSFALASSTQFSAASETFYIDSTGKVQAKDTTNNWSGRVSPTRSFGLSTGTTTTWTASTTGSGYSPHMVMPFAGTLRQVRCVPKIGATDGSFIGVNVKVNGSSATPTYFIASSTINKISFTAGNTFTAGQVILADFGTTTTATATSISCTFDVTET